MTKLQPAPGWFPQATMAHFMIERLRWYDVDEAHEEASRIDEFLSLAESLRPHFITDEMIARAIQDADEEKGVDWTRPTDLEAFRKYLRDRKVQEGPAGFALVEEEK